jgi:hypothetical protein
VSVTIFTQFLIRIAGVSAQDGKAFNDPSLPEISAPEIVVDSFLQENKMAATNNNRKGITLNCIILSFLLDSFG